MGVKKNFRGHDAHVSIETNALNSNTSSAFAISYINHLINDSSGPILFNFDAACSTATSTGGTFRLKAGEFIADFHVAVSALNHLTTAGTTAITRGFRALGGK